MFVASPSVPVRMSITRSFDDSATDSGCHRLVLSTAFVLTTERRPNWFHSGKVSAGQLSQTRKDEKLAIQPAAQKKFSRAERESVGASACGLIAPALTTFGFSTVRYSRQLAIGAAARPSAAARAAPRTEAPRVLACLCMASSPRLRS